MLHENVSPLRCEAVECGHVRAMHKETGLVEENSEPIEKLKEPRLGLSLPRKRPHRSGAICRVRWSQFYRAGEIQFSEDHTRGTLSQHAYYTRVVL